ncbi:MAG: hypothetical protein LUH82_08345 [Clostridiales bacterium]|nr:hypothetical protein [Clostridiales bacterium]
MKNKDSGGNSKNFLNLLKRNWVMVLLIILVAAYIAVSCFSVLNVSIQTQTAVKSTVYKTLSASALIIRQETVLESEDGVVVPSVSDGGKVAKNGEVAMVFSSDESAAAYSQYLEIEQQLEYYAALENKAVGQVTDVESIDKDIVSELGNYIKSLSGSYDADSVSDCADSLNDKLITRQLLIGEDVDFSSVVKELTEELNSIDLSRCKPSSYITAEESGIFSSYTDSLEDAFDYDSVLSLDVETLEAYIETAQSSGAAAANSFGKIITDFEWYLCAVVSTDDVKELENGDTVDITLSSSSEVLSCTIESGAGDAALGQEETVLILSCGTMNSSLAQLRTSDIEIRIEEYTGIMVPTQAVHVQDGEKGVYVLLSSVITWRSAEIKYTGDGYVILSYDDETDGGIKLYDEIIIKGTDLSDGKVYA